MFDALKEERDHFQKKSEQQEKEIDELKEKNLQFQRKIDEKQILINSYIKEHPEADAFFNGGKNGQD